MSLSSDLIEAFVKVTNDNHETKDEVTVYGTIVKYNGSDYVKLDGSDLLTPISSTTIIKDGDRVAVMIKNHTATVTGNITSPSASDNDLKETDQKVNNTASKISEFEIIVSYRVTAEEISAITGTIDNLKSKVASITELETLVADIEKLEAKFADLEYVSATDAEILNADIENLKAKFAEFTNISTEDLNAINGYIQNLQGYTAEFTYVSAEILSAFKADIKELKTDKLSVKDADIKYANIDFSNINEAAVKKIFSDSGIIKDLIVSEGKITGELVGVTIKGNLIEGGTVIADKLVVKGENGIYYKLNIEGGATTSEQVTKEDLQNGLSGSIIVAKSITAEKVAVDDLVAFGATIGGFNITDKSIYSGVKESVNNTTRGIYLDKDGQMAIGDGSNFIKYYKDTDGSYKLAISAKSIIFSSSNKNVEDTIDDIQSTTIVSTVEEFYQSTSPNNLIGDEWTNSQPTWIDGRYIWRRTLITYGDGTIKYTPSEQGVCITGNTGAKGEDSILLQILSSNGHMFKNSALSTTLTVEIIFGSTRITSSSEMYSIFGNEAKIIWQQKKFGETEFSDISSDDSRISDNGFIFTINAEDVTLQTVYNCYLDY